MRITFLLLICVLIHARAELSYAQSTKVSLDMRNISIENVLSSIEENTEFYFLYNSKLIDVDRKVDVQVKDKPVYAVLDLIFDNTDVSYRVEDRQIILSPTSIMQDNAKKVTGTVVDENGEPVIGVSILEKGTSNGISTDMNGKFTLNVPLNAILQVSYLGYITQEIPVSNAGLGNPLVIKLKEDMLGLEEIIVVGYGTQKKVNLTGAVTSVSSKELSKRLVGQPSLALQGAASGVTVTQRNGQPGVDGGDIRIRGMGTLNNYSPLTLVDGLEMSINNLDINTIESISVLKDAASASIYGSKAANGVILITTKRAQQGKFNISYNGYVARQSPTNLPKKVNALDHIMLLNESKINAGAGVVYTDEQINNWTTLGPSDRDHYPDTDWQKAVLTGNGLQQHHNLTLSGGGEKIRILAAIGYLGQNGILENVDFDRISLRLNTDISFTKQFSSTIDLFLHNSTRNSVGQYASVSSIGSGIGLVFGMMNKLPAVQAVKYSNGLYAEGQNGDNPVANIHEGGFYRVITTPVSANVSFRWQPKESIWIQTSFSPSVSYPMTKSFINKVSSYNVDGSLFSTLPAKTSLNMQSEYNRYLQSRTTANFQKSFAGIHNVAAMAGFQYESNFNQGFSAFRDEFLFPQYTVLSSGSVENMRNDGWASETALLSYFGRANYDFNGKYLLEANIRYDGSSKFAKGKKWGVFPSFSAGWRLSEEFFWETLKTTVPNLKIRGSWGMLGNQNISGNYPFSSNIDMGTKYVSDDKLVDGASVLTMNNPDITWETTRMTNIGIDLNLLNKLNLTFDYYYKKTFDILMVLAIPRTMGLEPTWQNAGTVENKGWDLTLTYSDRIGNFYFDISANLSDVKNKILDLKGINGTGLVTNREGYAINSLYLYQNLGMLSDADFNEDGTYKWTRQARPLKPGDLRYANLNEDDLVNSEDRKVLGSTIPRYTCGFTFSGRYKGLDVNLLLQGVGKADGYLTGQALYPLWSGSTAFEIHKDQWNEENKNVNAAFPRLVFYDNANNYMQSDFYMRSAAYLRIKNLQMGYTLPAALTKKVFIENLRFYISGENLYTFTNFWDGWDPEITPGSGGDYYPQVKIVSFGIDIKF